MVAISQRGGGKRAVSVKESVKTVNMLRLAVLSGCGLLSACAESEGESRALCAGQSVETITVESANRGGVYDMEFDVVTGECVTPQQQLEKGFTVIIDDSYNNAVNLVLAAQILAQEGTLESGANGKQILRWRDSFQRIYDGNTYTNNPDSFYSGDIALEFEFVITEDGIFRATTIAAEDADHLAIFGAQTGQTNYLSFDGAHLRTSAYGGKAKGRYNTNVEQGNILSHMLANTYGDLARGGALSNPLRDHAELFAQSPTVMHSHFSRNVYIMRSYLYHNRKDYEEQGRPALDVLKEPVVDTWTALWSPFGADDPDPAESLMSRSYNIYYHDGLSDDALTYLETWSGSHTVGARTSIRATGHYSGAYSVDHHGVHEGSVFAIGCSTAQSGCELSTARNAGVAVYMKGLMPTRVEMEMNNDWALGHTAVVTAMFSDWDTHGRTESPMRNNPNPLTSVIRPQ